MMTMIHHATYAPKRRIITDFFPRHEEKAQHNTAGLAAAAQQPIHSNLNGNGRAAAGLAGERQRGGGMAKGRKCWVHAEHGG